jgi:hypothetical protein
MSDMQRPVYLYSLRLFISRLQHPRIIFDTCGIILGPRARLATYQTDIPSKKNQGTHHKDSNVFIEALVEIESLSITTGMAAVKVESSTVLDPWAKLSSAIKVAVDKNSSCDVTRVSLILATIMSISAVMFFLARMSTSPIRLANSL